MNHLTPKERESILNRLQFLDAEATKLSQKAAFEGIKDWAAWDKLQQERTEIEKKLWGNRPPDV